RALAILPPGQPDQAEPQQQTTAQQSSAPRRSPRHREHLLSPARASPARLEFISCTCQTWDRESQSKNQIRPANEGNAMPSVGRASPAASLALLGLLLATSWPATDCAAQGKIPLPAPLTPYREAELSVPAARPQEALSVHEPMYFLLGDGKEFTARFQLSLKYRIFDPRNRLAQSLPPLQGLY